MEKKEEEKSGRWNRCRDGVRAAAIGEGVRMRVRCGGDDGEVSARVVVGH
jgi:hypothetical protein